LNEFRAANRRYHSIMPARAPDPHNLRNAAQRTAPIIDTDRRCAGCGYNLRGLRLGINCPECGLPTTMPEGGDDPLSTMPMRVILMLVRGCWAAAICVVLMMIALILHRIGLVRDEIAFPSMFMLSLFWLGAAIWLTPVITLPQAVSRGFGSKSRLRTSARVLQLGWVIAIGALAFETLVPQAAGPLAALVKLATFGGLCAGLAGLIVLSVLLERVAEWARDEDAQRMFNWTMWSWPLAILVLIPLMQMRGTIGPIPFAWGLSMFITLWAVSIGTFPYGLLMLAKSVTLSILHNLEYRGRQERKLERDQKHYERTAARSAKAESQPLRRTLGNR
jgi:hypothetical protein